MGKRTRKEVPAQRVARHVRTLTQLASESSWGKLRELVNELHAADAARPKPPDPRQKTLFEETL